VRLEPLQLWFRPVPGPLLSQLRPALATAAQKQAGPSAQLLRWAITGVETGSGLRIEAVVLVGDLIGHPSDPSLGSGQRTDEPQTDQLAQIDAGGIQTPGGAVPGNGNSDRQS
jgi:hypothetical protein